MFNVGFLCYKSPHDPSVRHRVVAMAAGMPPTVIMHKYHIDKPCDVVYIQGRDTGIFEHAWATMPVVYDLCEKPTEQQVHLAKRATEVTVSSEALKNYVKSHYDIDATWVPDCVDIAMINMRQRYLKCKRRPRAVLFGSGRTVRECWPYVTKDLGVPICVVGKRSVSRATKFKFWNYKTLAYTLSTSTVALLHEPDTEKYRLKSDVRKITALYCGCDTIGGRREAYQQCPDSEMYVQENRMPEHSAKILKTVLERAAEHGC